MTCSPLSVAACSPLSTTGDNSHGLSTATTAEGELPQWLPKFQPWITRIHPNRGQLKVTFSCLNAGRRLQYSDNGRLLCVHNADKHAQIRVV